MTDFSSISELAPRLRRREISPVEITRDCLERIERLNPALNAFITVMASLRWRRRGGRKARLARGVARGAAWGSGGAEGSDRHGGRAYDRGQRAYIRIGFRATDAEVVRRLRQAGAVIVGKNNLHEFAYGGSSLVSYFGDVHNPWDVGRIAGGSSGGSAAAVAAGLVYAAIGTDTAGRFASRRRCAGVWG